MTVSAPARKKNTPLELDAQGVKLDVEKAEEVSKKRKGGKVRAKEKTKVYQREKWLLTSLGKIWEEHGHPFYETKFAEWKGEREDKKTPILKPVKYGDNKKEWREKSGKEKKGKETERDLQQFKITKQFPISEID